MANSIELASVFVPILDEVYKESSFSSVLDGASDLARQGANYNELIIPKMTMQGLADYNKDTGYVSGDVTLTSETVKCNFDRGRMFSVDAMDEIETVGIAFGRLSGEFVRTQVVPELDAFRFAAYASADSIGKTEGDLSDGTGVIAALRTAVSAMDEAEVPMTERYLFITPTHYGMVQDLDTTKSREVLSRFTDIITVPQVRFYTAITQTAADAGGYTKGGSAKNINFMVIHKPAVIQYQKHVVPKIITPEQNQTADAWKFGYRSVGVADVYENKVKGIYLHNAAS